MTVEDPLNQPKVTKSLTQQLQLNRQYHIEVKGVVHVI